MGYIIVIATGRIYESINYAIDGFDFVNYVITDTGASCYDVYDGHTIFNNTIELGTAKKFKNFYNDNCVFIDVCDKHKIYKYSNIDEDYYFMYTTKDWNYIFNNCKEISHISISMKTNEQVMELYNKLKENIVELDINIPKGNKTNLKEFKNVMREYPELKSIIKAKICSGLTYSEGALSYVITIYIIKVFSESVSLGIFTSIFSVISIIIGFLFVKVIKPKYYIKLLVTTLPITIILLCIMLLNCNFVTVILYNLFQTISKLLSDLINERNVFNFSNIEIIKREYKVEYFLTLETALFIGRVISNTLFILMAFLDAKFIMVVFVIFVIMRSVSVIKLQYDMNKWSDVS